MLLDEIAEKLGEIYTLPVYKEGSLPKHITPFIATKRGNKNTLPIIDLLSTTGGILVFRSTGCSSSSARALHACDYYVRLYQSVKDTVGGYTGAIPSSNVTILFFGNYEKDKILELGVFPIELVQKPIFLGVI